MEQYTCRLLNRGSHSRNGALEVLGISMNQLERLLSVIISRVAGVNIPGLLSGGTEREEKVRRRRRDEGGN